MLEVEFTNILARTDPAGTFPNRGRESWFDRGWRSNWDIKQVSGWERGGDGEGILALSPSPTLFRYIIILFHHHHYRRCRCHHHRHCHHHRRHHHRHHRRHRHRRCPHHHRHPPTTTTTVATVFFSFFNFIY